MESEVGPREETPEAADEWKFQLPFRDIISEWIWHNSTNFWSIKQIIERFQNRNRWPLLIGESCYWLHLNHAGSTLDTRMNMDVVQLDEFMRERTVDGEETPTKFHYGNCVIPTSCWYLASLYRTLIRLINWDNIFYHLSAPEDLYFLHLSTVCGVVVAGGSRKKKVGRENNSNWRKSEVCESKKTFTSHSHPSSTTLHLSPLPGKFPSTKKLFSPFFQSAGGCWDNKFVILQTEKWKTEKSLWGGTERENEWARLGRRRFISRKMGPEKFLLFSHFSIFRKSTAKLKCW